MDVIHTRERLQNLSLCLNGLYNSKEKSITVTILMCHGVSLFAVWSEDEGILNYTSF